MVFVALALASVQAVSAQIVEPGSVQSVSAAEVAPTAACPTLQDKDGRPCGVVRKIELRRALGERAVVLINSAGDVKPCKEPATHAFILQTTKGTKVLPVSVRCGTVGGRALPTTTTTEVRDFLRSQGLITGL